MIKVRARPRCSVFQSRRTIVLPTVLNLIFGRESQLADAMAKGVLHNKHEDRAARLKEEQENYSKAYRNSRPMEPRYPLHMPLWPHEKLALFLVALFRTKTDPQNATNVVHIGELTAFTSFLENLKQTMLSTKDGRRILRDRPNISEKDLNMEKLAAYPENSFGRTFYNWLKKENITVDTRMPVQYIDDPTHAYIFQRYRQCHDFYHVVANMPILMEGEVVIKTLEAFNIGVPMAYMAMCFPFIGMKSTERTRLVNSYMPWAIETALTSKPLISVYWEEYLDKDIKELRDYLGIHPLPDLRAAKKEHNRKVKNLKLKYENLQKKHAA
ncbi:ubiquinone biosynthesis protein COQ4 Ecym_4156 [Eremothecium cymbalariae DBVPG|uniref:4-hydroxy-3-methoxy-5-polyprenylbenzoate decarboxylase n=1 Tax=Eremothecium cymbalariae (strain CBS 270.75 / DBVPG 7215 / KCTC 17166 / NRRL Y-17582) TaxID=931890 RepID=G8JT80_ERECY|nr:hypothetical protein Ecym_4156 [Eremothecium cymbalariae DBVPG\